MTKQHPGIADWMAEFIAAQPVFFVATAAPQGRINVSPKGLDGSFRVLGPRRVAWLNLTGSGNETAAHLLTDGRITIMFCAFSGSPLILRLYGEARAVHPRDGEWKELEALFPDYPAKRQIVLVEVDSAATSCGFGVPNMELAGQRPNLNAWAERKGPDGIADYWRTRNSVSLDGLSTGIMEVCPTLTDTNSR
jgi:Pyridoxamine 5'-phosphate oxidase